MRPLTVLFAHSPASYLWDSPGGMCVRERKGAGRERARKSNNRWKVCLKAGGREVGRKALKEIREASFQGREQLYRILLSDESAERLHKSPQPFQQVCFSVLSFSSEKHIMG